MAAPFTKFVSLLRLSLLITALGAMLKGGEPIKIWPKVTVEIINDLVSAPAQEDLTLHCKSKDDDIGFHTLKVGENYQFSFRPNVVTIAGFTLFFCSFNWAGETSLHYYDVYDQERDGCDFCSYKIWKGGPCRYDPTLGTYAQCHPWNPPQSHTQLGVAPWNRNATSHL